MTEQRYIVRQEHTLDMPPHYSLAWVVWDRERRDAWSWDRGIFLERSGGREVDPKAKARAEHVASALNAPDFR